MLMVGDAGGEPIEGMIAADLSLTYRGASAIFTAKYRPSVHGRKVCPATVRRGSCPHGDSS